MQVEVGQIIEGKVTGIKNFGAFVRLPSGGTGMVHISEVSSEYIQDLTQVLTEGQEVKVKVISISDEGKIALSIKKAQDNPAPAAKQARPQQRQQRQGGRADQGRVWQPKTPNAPASGFEEMMSRYKTQSEEKISDLRRVTEAHRGGGYSRRR